MLCLLNSAGHMYVEIYTITSDLCRVENMSILSKFTSILSFMFRYIYRLKLINCELYKEQLERCGRIV